MGGGPVDDAIDDDALTVEQARLLAELGRATGADPLPYGLVERAEQLLAYSHLDAELLALRDEEAAEPAGLRGGTSATRLRFDLNDGSIGVELDRQRDRLAGQVLAGELTEVVLERPGGTEDSAEVDELGRFMFAPAPTGPIRLRLRGRAGRSVTTEWFLA
jgi:hypothetical protein